MAGIEFRVLYENPRPVPASVWAPAKHGATLTLPAPILAIQFRDPDKVIDESDPANFVTVLVNEAVSLVTDEHGYYRYPGV